MPIYEYQCEFCGNRIEEIQKINDEPLVNCPACGKPGLHRLLSAPAFQLKGTGWYVTDFRGEKKDKPLAKTETTSVEKSKEEPSKAADSASSDKTEKKETKKTDE